MNLLINSLVLSFVSIQGFASDALPTNPQIQVTKTKITCSVDMVEKIKSNSEGSQDLITKGQVSESLRTTWSDGAKEYRFSDYRSINNNGETISVGKTTATFSSQTNYSRVTETTKSHTVVKYRDDFQVEGGNLKERNYEDVSVYLQLSANERILLSSVVDGKSVPTRDLREITTQISDKKKSVLYVEATPYTHEPFEGYVVEVLKSEMTCEFEVVE